MVLSDVYCVYNRARGTSLISPDDLLRACLLLDKYYPFSELEHTEDMILTHNLSSPDEPQKSKNSLGLPLQFRKFPSGLYAVQWATFSDSAFLEKLKSKIEAYRSAQSRTVSGPEAELIASYFPLTSTQFAAEEKLSIHLASQFLLVFHCPLEFLCLIFFKHGLCSEA